MEIPPNVKSPLWNTFKYSLFWITIDFLLNEIFSFSSNNQTMTKLSTNSDLIFHSQDVQGFRFLTIPWFTKSVMSLWVFTWDRQDAFFNISFELKLLTHQTWSIDKYILWSGAKLISRAKLIETNDHTYLLNYGCVYKGSLNKHIF